MSDSFIWTLLGHLVCIAQWAAFILVDYAYLGRGRRFRHPCVWAALLALAVLTLSVLCGFGFFNIKSVVSNIIYLLVIALLFGGTAVDRMSACIINGILCLLTENTVSFVFARLHGICPGEVWHYRTCLAALVISILLVGILVARFLCRWNHCSALDPLQALLMSFFPGVVVLLNIFIMISSNRRVPTLLDLMLTVGLTIAVLVHLAIVQMFNDQVVQGQASHFQAALEQQRAEALMESYTAQRRLTHEFTNHIAALDALLRQGDLTGAQEYLSSVSKVVAAGTTILDTHNPLLDSLLSRKYEEAAQQGVELYFDLCDLKDLPFCGTDLVIVISNLLDNAIRRRRRPNRRRCTCGRAGTRKNTSSRCATGCRRTWSWWMGSCRVPPRQSRAMAWALSTCGRCWTAAAASTRSAVGTAGSALPVRCLPASCDSYRCRI